MESHSTSSSGSGDSSMPDRDASTVNSPMYHYPPPMAMPNGTPGDAATQNQRHIPAIANGTSLPDQHHIPATPNGASYNAAMQNQRHIPVIANGNLGNAAMQDQRHVPAMPNGALALGNAFTSNSNSQVVPNHLDQALAENLAESFVEQPPQDSTQLLHLYEASKRAILRMQHDVEAMSEMQRDTANHNAELRAYNNQLRGEIADLRAQLSYATSTLSAQIREQVDSAKSTGSSERKLQGVIDEQHKALIKISREQKTNVKRIEQLKQSLSEAKRAQQSQQNATNPEQKKTKGQRRRERLERERLSALVPAPTPESAPVPVRPQVANPTPAPSWTTNPQNIVTKKEVIDLMDIDNEDTEEERFMALLDDNSHEKHVVEQLKRYMRRRTGKKNLMSFFNDGKKNQCFCIHEVVSRGKAASTQLFPTTKPCRVNGAACDFLVEVIQTDSGRKLRTFSPWGTYTPRK
ncbi:hypothetical protein FLONG3_5290 [Fusarium longipes]|uniref:Uncharacterized protein n=1 Tax=Fusarium longipes TaxID=694270 RepID=A0A395SVZ5_9HYPO|nr:hypothetical protein FLONG3_5290 [Fusarium longipes]